MASQKYPVRPQKNRTVCKDSLVVFHFQRGSDYMFAEGQFPRLDAAGIKYARSAYNVIYTAVRTKDNRSYALKLSTEIKGLDIFYTFDGTNPDPYYPKYTGEPISFPVGATQITANTFRNGKMVRQQVTIKKDDLPARFNQGRHIY